MRKLMIALVLAMVLALATTVPAFAGDGSKHDRGGPGPSNPACKTIAAQHIPFCKTA